mmetsp:Transcript_14459/g.36184  ORF Transcript_14459/g.36184 Transcript_14459/m.36184 type:complete len:266 (+) Transcript_14459:3656-4453(+)
MSCGPGSSVPDRPPAPPRPPAARRPGASGTKATARFASASRRSPGVASIQRTGTAVGRLPRPGRSWGRRCRTRGPGAGVSGDCTARRVLLGLHDTARTAGCNSTPPASGPRPERAGANSVLCATGSFHPRHGTRCGKRLADKDHYTQQELLQIRCLHLQRTDTAGARPPPPPPQPRTRSVATKVLGRPPPGRVGRSPQQQVVPVPVRCRIVAAVAAVAGPRTSDWLVRRRTAVEVEQRQILLRRWPWMTTPLLPRARRRIAPRYC